MPRSRPHRRDQGAGAALATCFGKQGRRAACRLLFYHLIFIFLTEAHGWSRNGDFPWIGVAFLCLEMKGGRHIFLAADFTVGKHACRPDTPFNGWLRGTERFPVRTPRAATKRTRALASEQLLQVLKVPRGLSLSPPPTLSIVPVIFCPVVRPRLRRGRRTDVLYRAGRPNHAVTCKMCPGFFVCGDCFNRQSYQHPPDHQVRGKPPARAAFFGRAASCWVCADELFTLASARG